MKLSIAALAALALLFFQRNASADQWNKHWSVGPHPELHINAGDAAVEIQGTNSNAIEANLKTEGWKIGPSGIEVIDHQSGNIVQIDIKVPHHHFDFGQHSIRLELRVPREIQGDIHTGDGSIKLRDVHGGLRVSTGDGSIQADNLDGKLDASTGDGSVHAGGRFDDLQLRTNDGSVDLDVLAGSKMQSDWRVHTGDGSVQLTLPHDLAADLELSTGDGHIGLNMPASTTLQNEHELHAKLNGGGALLTVKTGDGSISINSR